MAALVTIRQSLMLRCSVSRVQRPWLKAVSAPNTPPTPSLGSARMLTSTGTAMSSSPTSSGDATTPPTDAQTKPRRPSPYRLIPTRTFLAQFAPLHVSGWRLEPLPTVGGGADKGSGEVAPTVEETGDLQEYRLTRAYHYEQTRDGWEGVMKLVQRVGEVVADEDHHPTILIAPSRDVKLSSESAVSNGYVVQVATHTHTPMPVLPPGGQASASSPGKTDSGKKTMRPGVTGKDLRLAEAVEEVYREVTGNVVI